MSTWLVDTGPLVAYLDAADPVHASVASCWDGFRGRVVTSSAVITEAMHFVAAATDGPERLAALVTASAMDVLDLCQPPELRAAAALMARYADTPMDFADATLLLVAEALDVTDILTLDRRGFAAYRTRANQALRNVLDARSA